MRDIKSNAKESVRSIEVNPKYYKLDSILQENTIEEVNV